MNIQDKKKIMQVKAILIELEKIYDIYRFKLPSVLAYVTFLMISWQLYRNNKPLETMTALLVVLAISIALSQTLFQYASMQSDKNYKEYVIGEGEKLLLGSIYLATAMTLIYLSEYLLTASKSEFQLFNSVYDALSSFIRPFALFMAFIYGSYVASLFASIMGSFAKKLWFKTPVF